MPKKGLSCIILGLSLSMCVPNAQAQYSYTHTSLLTIVEDIQQKTDFRFLYRESLISDIRLSFSANNENLFSTLSNRLTPYALKLKVDSTRQQAVLFKIAGTLNSQNNRQVTLTGQVIDAETGERLPFATLSWSENGQTTGTSCTNAGTFQLRHLYSGLPLTIKASYIGYKPNTIVLDPKSTGSEEIQDIAIRLEPTLMGGNELIVTGNNYYNAVDPAIRSYVDMGRFSPLGDASSLRALQVLPSVGLSAALSGNMHVRGSSDDGLQVLLDGITIYNQNHLFGLLDSFNADALKTSGFFYDITPAQYQGTPGGTLALLTKTGSLQKTGGTAGISNSSARLTLQGPLVKGRSSWLLSGRTSYMNQVHWLNNSDLIKWGLDVNRPKKITEVNPSFNYYSLSRPAKNNAYFYDLHGKLYFEGRNGSRLIISGYTGGDHSSQDATRLLRNIGANTFSLQDVNTGNEWNNMAGSLQYQTPLSETLYSHTTAALSIYQTSFNKDDFTYTRLNNLQNTFQAFTYPFANKSVLNEFKADQQFSLNYASALWTFGATYQYYLGEYYEHSFNRISQFFHDSAHKTSFYVQADFTSSPLLNLHAGSRLFYYSNGKYLRWSPRIKARLFPHHKLSLGAGYSRNYQFLNQITFSNAISSNVWVLANREQPPINTDYFTSGLYYKPADWLYVQTEAYIKKARNLRLHEIDTFSLTNTFSNAPWFYDNTGSGRGIEFLLRNQYRSIEFTQTFTLSRMEMKNSQINGGQPFPADWDRAYQYSASLKIPVLTHLSAFLSFTYAGGTPDKLAEFGSENAKRLRDYYRTDISLKYSNKFTYGRFEVSVSLFNIFDRQNPWYREMTPLLEKSSSYRQITGVPVVVYDMGFQPSFNLSFGF